MPRFRVGRSVPINAYDGNDPIFQGHSPEEVAELVRLLNLGARSEEFTDAYTGSLRDAMGLTPPDAPPSAHESPSEPPAATGQPADDSGPQTCLWRGPLFNARADHRCPNAAKVRVERRNNAGEIENAPLCHGHADLAVDVFGWDLAR